MSSTGLCCFFFLHFYKMLSGPQRWYRDAHRLSKERTVTVDEDWPLTTDHRLYSTRYWDTREKHVSRHASTLRVFIFPLFYPFITPYLRRMIQSDATMLFRTTDHNAQITLRDIDWKIYTHHFIISPPPPSHQRAAHESFGNIHLGGTKRDISTPWHLNSYCFSREIRDNRLP